MLSYSLKRATHKFITSDSPNPDGIGMNNREPEDLDFPGLQDNGDSPENKSAKIIKEMNLDEKLSYISGYKSLGIHALPRHGLPSVWMSDATSGVRSYGDSIAFPSAIAMAATWNPNLVAKAANGIAETARAKGVSIILAPGINIARIPTCGRNFEYMGEDPFLAGKMASAYVRACQAKGVICTIKHLCANNSEYNRHRESADVDERTLREIYLPAFEMTIKEGKALGVMSSYNLINGVWASENRWLLNEILRKEWGFQGFVISDWTSLYSTEGPVSSGLDLEMPIASWLKPERVKKAIDKENIDEKQIDGMVFNIMCSLFKAGIYQRPVKDREAREIHPAHKEAALDTAREAVVLLKNKNSTLPLPDGKGITIAVCGPNAVNTPIMGGGSCNFSCTSGGMSLIEGLKKYSSRETRIVHVPWKRLNQANQTILTKADAVVLSCGFNHIEESEFYDRPWRLPLSQRRLIKRVSSLNSRTTVVLTSGGDVETASWIDKVPAFIHSLYLGQSVGRVLAEVLLGIINPSGHLPFSMARSWSDIPSVKNYPKRYWTTTAQRLHLYQGKPRLGRIQHRKYSEKLMVGYRHFDTSRIKPIFAFGHGLSYTDFQIEKIESSAKDFRAGEKLELTVQVRNTGKRAGSVAVQIYVQDVESALPRPMKELKGFSKVNLQPDQSKSVSIVLDDRAFSYWNPNKGSSGAWIAEPGEFLIMAGTSSENIQSQLQTTII